MRIDHVDGMPRAIGKILSRRCRNKPRGMTADYRQFTIHAKHGMSCAGSLHVGQSLQLHQGGRTASVSIFGNRQLGRQY